MTITGTMLAVQVAHASSPHKNNSTLWPPPNLMQTGMLNTYRQRVENGNDIRQIGQPLLASLSAQCNVRLVFAAGANKNQFQRPRAICDLVRVKRDKFRPLSQC
uniref:Putative secreted protein n=1 Tax=Ixodes ricinus TaxID=34613 RepID=A0A6B0U884_IXORI